jgi:hypothetical protein
MCCCTYVYSVSLDIYIFTVTGLAVMITATDTRCTGHVHVRKQGAALELARRIGQGMDAVDAEAEVKEMDPLVLEQAWGRNLGDGGDPHHPGSIVVVTMMRVVARVVLTHHPATGAGTSASGGADPLRLYIVMKVTTTIMYIPSWGPFSSSRAVEKAWLRC